jgi:hypothetical protein
MAGILQPTDKVATFALRIDEEAMNSKRSSAAAGLMLVASLQANATIAPADLPHLVESYAFLASHHGEDLPIARAIASHATDGLAGPHADFDFLSTGTASRV